VKAFRDLTAEEFYKWVKEEERKDPQIYPEYEAWMLGAWQWMNEQHPSEITETFEQWADRNRRTHSALMKMRKLELS
jgi:hypothetical protein